MEWIDVKKRLPKQNELVMIYEPDRYQVGYLTKNGWPPYKKVFEVSLTGRIGDGYPTTNVTHWAYLPEAPERRII